MFHILFQKHYFTSELAELKHKCSHINQTSIFKIYSPLLYVVMKKTKCNHAKHKNK